RRAGGRGGRRGAPAGPQRAHAVVVPVVDVEHRGAPSGVPGRDGGDPQLAAVGPGAPAVEGAGEPDLGAGAPPIASGPSKRSRTCGPEVVVTTGPRWPGASAGPRPSQYLLHPVRWAAWA